MLIHNCFPNVKLMLSMLNLMTYLTSSDTNFAVFHHHFWHLHVLPREANTPAIADAIWVSLMDECGKDEMNDSSLRTC